MLDSGAGASVCSPNDFPTIAIHTQSEVTKVYRACVKVYGYKWVKAIVGKTQQILQIRLTIIIVTVLDVLRPIIALSCLVQGGWDLSFGGAPVEATATHRGTPRRLGLIQKDSFEEDVTNALRQENKQEHVFHEGEEQNQQEAGEMKVPLAPSEEERRYHNLTHYPYKEWCDDCVRGRGPAPHTKSR
eukprot:5929492-Amphidinium_carterae.2